MKNLMKTTIFACFVLVLLAGSSLYAQSGVVTNSPPSTKPVGKVVPVSEANQKNATEKTNSRAELAPSKIGLRDSVRVQQPATVKEPAAIKEER